MEANQMFEIMSQSGGIGLAANQVGLNKQVFIMRINEQDIVFINPSIIHKSDETSVYEEGCLSFPKLYIPLERPKTITVAWQDLEGQQQVKEFSDLAAICIQHEIDHLNGIVFINNLKPAKKQQALSRYSKLAKK